ncbi:uncharacterized protein TNCT_191631, partial [Trichonephila clavata]
MKLKIELDLVREQLVQAIEAPTSYEVTELHELPAICGVDVDSELKMERDQLKQERDQLKHERDQLKEERYKFWGKSNHLKEEGDQLKEERNQLWGENKQLEVERDQLWEQNNQLKIERDQLKFEKNQLIEEKAQFWKENEQLKIEKNQLNEEKGQLLNENNQLKVEKDQFWKENDSLMKENNSLKVHVNKLTQHGKELANEFTQEKYKLDKQCNVSKKQWETFLKECKKLVDPVNIQTFVTDVQKKYSVHEEIDQNGVQLLNYFHMTLSNHNWSQEIISKFKQLEYYKVQYEKLLADHEEMQNKSEKELESIMEDNNKQQQQLKQQLMKCETDLIECREKLMEPKSETIVERGTCISIQNRKFKRRSPAEEEEDNEEYWRTRCFELEKQLSKPTHEISLLKMKCLFMAFFHLYFKLMYDFKWKKLPQELEPDLNREIWDKLKRLDNLLKQDRDNELLNTLLIYVDAELRVILLGECAVNIFKDKLKKLTFENKPTAADPLLENKPIAVDPPLENKPTAVDPPLENKPTAADPLLENKPDADDAYAVWDDPMDIDEDKKPEDKIHAVIVDNYEEPSNDEKEEFYPNKSYALERLNYEKYAVDHVGNEIYNPFSNRYASYPVEKDKVTHKIQFVPRNKDGSFNFLKDSNEMIIYPFNLTMNQPIFPRNPKGEDMYFRINNIDHYPRNTNGKPIYVKNKEGREVPPFNQNEPFYASDANGNECYPKDSNGDEYYIWKTSRFSVRLDKIMSLLGYPRDVQGNEFYLQKRERDEYYLTQRKPSSIFALKNGLPYYAKDKDQNEFYPVVNDEELAISSIIRIYAKDAKGNQKYPRDKEGNEKALPRLDLRSWQYATDKEGNAFYPKNKFGKEVLYGDYIQRKDGSIQYPLTEDGNPEYEIDYTTRDEYYFIKKDESINWGEDINGNQRYAKKANGDEYYPPNGELAYDHSGSPQYARTEDGQSTRSYKEVILNGEYARTNLQEVKYKLDEYGNEYTLELPPAGKVKDSFPEGYYFPLGYPITNDNWVIVPEVDGKEYISDLLWPKVQSNNIIGKLYRDGKNFRDYVTDVKSTRLSRAARQKYKTFPYNVNNPPLLNNPLKPPPILRNNPLNPPRIPRKKKKILKISYHLNWSLIGI